VEHFLLDFLKQYKHIEDIDLVYRCLLEFSELVYSENKKYNLTGCKDVGAIIKNLIIDSLSPILLDNVPRGTSVIDMGTGSGVPGIPLAILYPWINFTLLDSSQKKISFVNMAVEVLGVKNVCTVTARAEDLARDKRHRESYDFLCSRAMSDVYMAAELGSPFVKPSGFLYLYVSDKQKSLIRFFMSHLNDLSLEPFFDGERDDLPVRITSGLLLRKNNKIADIYPRRISVIKRSMLNLEKDAL